MDAFIAKNIFGILVARSLVLVIYYCAVDHAITQLFQPVRRSIGMTETISAKGQTSRRHLLPGFGYILGMALVLVAMPAYAQAGYRTTFPTNSHTAYPAVIKNGRTVNLTAQLVSSNGPVPGANVGLYVNNKLVASNKTNAKGFVTFTITYRHPTAVPSNGTRVPWFVNFNGAKINGNTYLGTNSRIQGPSFFVKP